MTETFSDTARINQIRAGARAAWANSENSLQVRGGLLVYRDQRRCQMLSVFLPAAAFSVSHRSLRDHHILWRHVAAPAAGIAALLLAAPRLMQGWEQAYAQLMTTAAVVLLAGAIAWVVTSLLQFIQRRPTTRLDASTAEWGASFEFWHHPGSDGELDSVVRHLKRLGRARRDAQPVPITFAHDWSFAYPVKTAARAVAKAYVSLFCALLLLYAASIFAGWPPYVPPMVWGLMLAPPLMGLMWLTLLRKPLGKCKSHFRAAMRHFQAEEYAASERALQAIFDHNPNDGDALYLMVHLCLRRGDYEKALACCNRMEAIAGEEAAEIAEDVWRIRRMQERIEAE